MNNVYDNWERLVAAVLKRQEFRELARAHSRESSLSSVSAYSSSSFSFSATHFQDPEASSNSSSPFDNRDDCYGESPPTPRPEYGILQLPNAMPISFNELKNATTNFGPDSYLGDGEFGPAYKGWINLHTFTAEEPGCGMTVAIQSCNDNDMPQFKQWMKEVGQLHHPNLIKLIAYCNKDDNKLLVHEFMPNGSLDDHLFTRGAQCLSWATRIKVAIGVARGLSFLHNAKNNKIHGNLKSLNILLDEEFDAKLSDFRYFKEKLVPYKTLTRSSNVAWWNLGYAPPECKYKGFCTKECDVYAFGVVLLELLSGRRARVEPLVSSVRPYLSSKTGMHQIMDTKLEGKYHHEAAPSVAALALQCVSNLLYRRPDMADVLAALEQLQHLSETQSSSDSSLYISVSSSSSSPFDKRDYSGGESPSISGSEDDILQLPIAIPISFTELKNATGNFRPDSYLWHGEFCSTYKGWMDMHTLIAKKRGRAMAVAIERYKDMPRFKKWLKKARQLHHPNLNKLIAYCDDDCNKLLVHEFMPNRSLDYHLFGRGPQCLSWATRIKVAIGAARGLSFLHSAKNDVMHGRFKSSNILLDEEFNAKLSGWGCAEHLRGDYETPASNLLLPWYDIGYAAPEYGDEGYYTKNCDVYAFGVVLLELLSGRRPIYGKGLLVVWAKQRLSNNRRMDQVVDTKLEGKYPHEEASSIADLALQCVSYNSNERPDMVDVLAALEQLQDLSEMQSSNSSL